ncbi:MAG: prepilin-type N-terminal cleavage/methylation domain-containing protein [Planctomycetota bacterium]
MTLLKLNSISPQRRRDGLTLVELLVVMGILAILAAILIPRMRIVNKDRNIREAARVVASSFASASQRAINDTDAGIEIQRNTNILDANGVNYAGTVIYHLRKVHPFTGDSAGAEARAPDSMEQTTYMINAGTSVMIDRPWEQDELDIIQVNDFISFNYSSVRYRISAVGPAAADPMPITIDFGDSALPPLPTQTSGNVPFIIHRKPRRLESSRTELPEGYIIDLRLSGSINPAPAAAMPPYGMDPRPYSYEVTTESVGFLFNRQGGLDTYYPNFTAAILSTNNVFLLIREYDVDEPSLEEVLANPANLWVTVGQQTGAANVADITPDDGAAGTLANRIFGAQRSATTGLSTNQ